MALTYQAAVEQTITAGEQIHQIVNGTATTEVTVEDGSKVPSIRKALLDNFYFKDPIAWQVGQTESVFNQLRKFTDGSWWYAPSATASNPISMGATPVGNNNWKVYSLDAVVKLTPQLREALRRSYAEAGYNLVAGSFEAGGTLVNVNDVLLQERTGKAFSGPAGTVSAGTNPTSGGFVDVSAKLLRHSTSPSISFIFDDAWASVSTVLKPLFDTYNAKFGIAVPTASLGSPNRLTNQSLMEFSRDGYEVLNHAVSGDVMATTDKGIGGVKGELATCWDTLNILGIKATGFVTPSSTLNGVYIGAIGEFCDYAFTKDARTTPIKPTTNPKALHRFSVEGNTSATCLTAIDNLRVDGGALVFYAHDIASGDANYLKIQAILNKCATDGVPVLLPRECVSKSVSPVGNSVRAFVEGELIDNRVDNWNVTGGATYTTDANKDMTVTVTEAGSFLIQKIVNITNHADTVDLLTWSASVRNLSSNILTNSTLAIRLYSGVDGTGTQLYATQEKSAKPNSTYVRYYAEAAQAGAKSALLYIRVSVSDAGTFLVRAPVFRRGSSISQRKYVNPTLLRFTGTIPTQSIAANVGYTLVTLTNVADNNLYKVENNTFIFLRDAAVAISVSLVANGAGVANGWLGGSCALSINGETSCISPVGGGGDHIAGCASVTLGVTRGTAISVRCLATGVAFAIGSANSRYLVTEL